MARQQGFGYHNIVLYKSQTLGTGSYGGVCKAKCDGLPCAAKIMHPTLFDLCDPGTTSHLRRFEEECSILSLARHPNIVQYLATYRDPETNLPVLLMELCDESLCRFLERSVWPLPYHIELNISHDIALALVYLHSNGLIHRDLTSNNVLMVAGVRAKVTDFGMSKLTSVNPRMTPLTLCPGNLLYMAPEALEEPPSYTEKLDIFSFGVLEVQIMTRQFPDPGPRFQVVDLPDDSCFLEGTVRVMVSETQRRSAHLQLINRTHPLKLIALNCLKDRERERPSAQQLSNTLSELKQAPQYEESMQQAQPGEENGQEVASLRRWIRDLQQQHQEQQQENEHLREENHKQQEENKQLHLWQQQYMAKVHQLVQQLQGQQVTTEARERENQQLQNIVEEKEKEIQQKTHTIESQKRELQHINQTIQERERELHAREQSVAQFQQSMTKKEKFQKAEERVVQEEEGIQEVEIVQQAERTQRAEERAQQEMERAQGAEKMAQQERERAQVTEKGVQLVEERMQQAERRAHLAEEREQQERETLEQKIQQAEMEVYKLQRKLDEVEGKEQERVARQQPTTTAKKMDLKGGDQVGTSVFDVDQ